MNAIATVGILGGGQLGRMLALAGLPLGLRFRFLENQTDCPAAAVGEVIVGRYDDPAALERFARGIDVATYEFENVPAATARWLTEHVSVFPPERVLAIAQDRLSEKEFFRELGVATPDFIAIDDFDQLPAAAEQLGFPSILKTRRFGYDGKGQMTLRSSDDIQSAAERRQGDVLLGRNRAPESLILESLIPFRRELSIIAARSRTGEDAFYPLTQNTHRNGILRESIAPAPGLTPELQLLAESVAERVLDHTGYIGVLAIELFELADGTLLANEIAPRVHNSGHWTQDGAGCSQFENHLRAILGWPLGATGCHHPHKGGTLTGGRGPHCAMLNILRELPDPKMVLGVPGAHLHLYGKSPRAGGGGGELRKIGHMNIIADDAQALDERLVVARSRLARCL